MITNQNWPIFVFQFLKEDIQKKATEGGHKFEFDYDKNSGYEKGNYFGKDLWYTTALFASPSKFFYDFVSFINK